MSQAGTPTNSKLENAPKEDLIKLLKRQQLLLKKANAKDEADKALLKENISRLTEELELHQSQVVQLTQENDDIYESNKKITKEFEELKLAMGQQEIDTSEKIKSLIAAVNRLTCDNEDRQCELDVYRDNQEQLKTLLKQAQETEYCLKTTISGLEEKLLGVEHDRDRETVSWKEHLTELDSQLAESNARVAEAEKNLGLQKELFEAKSDIALLRSEGDSLKSMMISYNEQFAMETSTIAQVLSSLGNSGPGGASDSQKSGEEGSKEVTDIVDEVLDTPTCLEQKVAENDIITELREEITKLKEELCDNTDNTGHDENVAEEVSRLKVLLRNVEEEKHNIKLHLNQFLSENNDLKDRESETELESLRAALEETEVTLLQVGTELTAARRELATKGEELAELVESHKVQLQELEESHRGQVEEVEEGYKGQVEELGDTLSCKTEEIQLLRQQMQQMDGEAEALRTERDSLRTERDLLSSQLFIMEEQLNQLTSDLECERSRAETLEQSVSESDSILDGKKEEISRLAKELELAFETNNKLKEDTQGSHSLMNMELADYHRATEALQEKLRSTQAENAQLETELQQKEGAQSRASNDIMELEKQRANLDEMIAKLKVLLMKAKKEAADSKKSEEDAIRETGEARSALETTVQQLEECKLELGEVRGQLATLTEGSRKKADERGALVKNLEARLVALQEEIERERDMRLEISGQYESYKVRVHGVLKQHKTGDTTIGISEHEAIVIQLSQEGELLKCRLHEATSIKNQVEAQRDELEEELTTVIGNLERVETESSSREKFYQERIWELEESVRAKEQQIFSNLQSGAAQRSSLTDSYSRTLEQTNATHSEASQMLQNRIQQLEAELSVSSPALRTPVPSQSPESTTTSTPLKPPKIRPGAEGMESPGPSGLEELLNSSVLSRSSSRVSVPDTSVAREDSKVCHLSSLLAESEHNSAALQEQCAVLKGEVRRLENMLGRGTTNIEYLKNIVMKYLTAEPGAREQLVPVLCTVLKLTRDEREVLNRGAVVGKREPVPWF